MTYPELDRFTRIAELEHELRELKFEETRELAAKKRKARFDDWIAGYGPDTLEPKS